MAGSRIKSMVVAVLFVLLTDLVVLWPTGFGLSHLLLRAALSIALIAFVPGFCILSAIYPEGGLGEIEVIGYSVMISLLVSPLMAFAMNFLPSGFGTIDRPAPLLLALSVLTICAALAASLRGRERPKRQK